MVIFSHTRSLTSSPELGVARALAILYMGVVRVSFTRSRSDSGMEEVRLGEELEVIVDSVGLPANWRPY